MKKLFILLILFALLPANTRAQSVEWEAPVRQIYGIQNAEPIKYFAGHNIVRAVFIGSQSYWTEQRRSQGMESLNQAILWWKARMPKAVYSVTIEQEYFETLVSSGEDSIHTYFQSKGYRDSNNTSAAVEENRNLLLKYNGLFAFQVFFLEYMDRSYAYINGPYTIIFTLNVEDSITPILTHEIGHIYNAQDQYLSARVDCRTQSGIYNVETQNSDFSSTGIPCNIHQKSIMKEHIIGYRDNVVDTYALSQMGYRDSDFDGVIDIVDNAAGYTLFLPIK